MRRLSALYIGVNQHCDPLTVGFPFSPTYRNFSYAGGSTSYVSARDGSCQV